MPPSPSRSSSTVVVAGHGGGGARAARVRAIFERFDANRDGALDRTEMAALVVAVNPRVRFSGEQISAILDEVFRTYSDFVLTGDDGGAGLSLPGLLRTYDDGAGDVDRDFEALGLELPSAAAEEEGTSAGCTSDDRERPLTAPQDPPPPRSSVAASWAASPNHGVTFDSSWLLLEDLEILAKRLRSKQLQKGRRSTSGDNDNNFDSFSDSGWSREVCSDSSERRFVWDETSRDYLAFVKEVAVLRIRADRAATRGEAFDNQMALGRGLYERRLFRESFLSFRRACELVPYDARPHFRAGNALYALGRHGEAKEEYLLALEAAEAGGSQSGDILPQVHVNLGIAMEAEGMILSACEHYREAAILSPTHFRALKLLGSALFGVGEYRAAEKALQEAIFLQPDYADAHCDLGSALHAAGEDERAIQEFQRAIDLKPGHMEAMYNLGGLYMDAGRFARACEMYTRILCARPNYWPAQLNKAVALLGAGESVEAKRALKEALKMTQRVEVYDAIAHLKMLKKKKKKKLKGNEAEGEGSFIVVEASKFKRVGRKTTPRQDLANALDIRSFQRATRLCRCNVDHLKGVMNGTDIPISYSGNGQPEKAIRKAALEVILRKLLQFLSAETFQGAVKQINQKVLSVLDSTGSGRVDLGVFFAVLAPICSGHPDERKRVVFDSLLWRPRNGGEKNIRRSDAVRYIKLLRAIYIPSHGISEMMEVHGESDPSVVSYTEFLEMFNDPDWGFGVLDTLVKLEAGDRIRHGKHTCSTCCYPITGSRFKEMKSGFSLCNHCYSKGKVPSAFKKEEYKFMEYRNEAEAMKDRCMCFCFRSTNSDDET